jgi:hypothetical protein
MFRIVSRSRRNAKGAGYGWLLVGCGTLASIGGNVAHAQPDLVAQGIAAAIPLAVLAMLEGLKGDAGEVTRLAAQPAALDHPSLTSGRSADTTTLRRADTRPAHPAAGGTGVRQLPARPATTDAMASVRTRLEAAYRQGQADGRPWTARTLAEAAGCGRSSAASFLQRQRPSAAERTQ